MNMPFQIWHLWVIAALLLIIVELFTTFFVAAVLGVSCLVPALLSALGFGYGVQLFGLAVAITVTSIWIRPICLKYFHREPHRANTNVDGLIGKSGFVVEKIDHTANTGRVRIGGEDWRAVMEDHAIVRDVGAKVTVQRVEGCKVVVK